MCSVSGGRCAAVAFALPRSQSPDFWSQLRVAVPGLLRGLGTVRPGRLLAGLRAAEYYESQRDAVVQVCS